MCWIFLIPIVSYLFFGYAVNERNEQVNNLVYESLYADKTASNAEKLHIQESFNLFDYASVCGEKKPEFQTLITSLGSLCDDFYYYNVGSELSFYSILISVVMLIFTLGFFLLSFKSQTIQYKSFVISWNISKLFCIAQVAIQGTLLLAVCFFGTVLLWNTYYPQILIFIGLPVGIACLQMIGILISRTKIPNYVIGHPLTQTEAPTLYEELTRICNKFDTDLPDNVVLGIEDNFFVTEHELTLNDDIKLIGKTLYLSIFHLKKLNKLEASAIFAHEIAHFSGEDTFFSKKTMPMLAKCDECLMVLHSRFITIPAAYFLLFFRGLFEISFGKVSRMREYRADFMAADYVGAKALVNGLVKFVFYSEYRASIEEELILKNEQVKNLDFLKQIEDEVHDFAKDYTFEDNILNQVIHHPFDSHPPMYKRIEAVGYTLDIEDIRAGILNDDEDSWYHEIKSARSIELELMKAFEDDFISTHEQNLVYQLIPTTDEETELVEKYFPPVGIVSKNGKTTLNITCKTFKYSTWEDEVNYDDVESFLVKKPLFRKKRMLFNLKNNKRLFFPIKCFSMGEEEVAETFSMYYSRFIIANDYEEEILNAKE